MRIVIAGVTGRMGREVAAVAEAEPGVEIVGGTVRPGSSAAEQTWQAVTGVAVPGARIVTDARELLAGEAVLIDFTAPAATVAHARACAATGAALVSGTTGLSAAEQAAVEAAAARVPVFLARNMSQGVSALLAALPAIMRALSDYDVEIIEAHHRHKADAPSGTALALAEAITAVLGTQLDERAVFGRHGLAPRQGAEIGIHAVRGGGNPGEHTVVIADEGEEVRLSHRAFGRRAYARGALRAAAFVHGRPPGLYGVADLQQ